MDEEARIQELRAWIAQLESKVDLLEAELEYINRLLLEVGFPNGTEGLKEAIEEVLRSENTENP